MSNSFKIIKVRFTSLKIYQQTKSFRLFISFLFFQDNKPLVECRVRYLSFLGIGHNVKQCAFIMHTAQDLFIAHVFHCEPSSGALCKTVEAACKVRSSQFFVKCSLKFANFLLIYSTH